MSDIVERMKNYIPGEPAHEEAVPEVLELAIAEIERLRRVLEIIAGSAADRLQALQARAALDNIGAKVPIDRVCAHPHCSCPPDARCPQ